MLSTGLAGLALAASADSVGARAAVDALVEASHPMALEAAFPLEKTAAFRAVAALGPNAIPALGERLESSDAPGVRVLLGTALFRIAGFTFYWHSGDETRDLGGLPLRHPQGEPFPLLSCRIGREHLGAMPEMEIAWRAWQQARRDLAGGSLREEIGGIGHVPDTASPDVVDTLHARYRLAQARYGICAVPALVTRVHQHDDQLAFLTFLRIARPVRYQTLNAPPAPGPALAHLASAWPSHADRMSAVRAWWAEARPTFALLPDLQGEIDAAVSALPEP
jgi:hypothetical protein